MEDLDFELKKIKNYLDLNPEKKKELISEIPYGLGKDWDPTDFFDYFTEKKFLVFYHEVSSDLGEYGKLSIEKMNKPDLPYTTLKFLYKEEDLGEFKVYLPLIAPNPNFIITKLLPFMYSLSGRRVKREEFKEKAKKLNIKENRSIKKFEDILDSDTILEEIEEIITKFGEENGETIYRVVKAY